MALPWKSYRFLFKKLSKTQHVSGVFVDVEVNVDGDLHIDLDDDVDVDVLLHQLLQFFFPRGTESRDAFGR